MIQTSQPKHPVYQKIANNLTTSLNSGLLQERKDLNFPPYTRIIEIHVKDKYENKARQMSERLSETLRSVFSPSEATFLNDPVTGPYAPTVDKVADQYIRTIRLSLKKDRSLSAEKEKLRKTVATFEKAHRYDGHITINVDPA